ncbi:hypothetical protein [Acaryochloris marina]|uniref:Uncharacterized protein n=1 Tax=Acaryochloris marina (strain MBIC 11017) TaxID=329726 RepID=A8ZPU2_ACAM1|nr:hypothetical protein [Acaryochloris marina]ABW33036.1 hypothetical protein AM1_F0149 [Acaryochloris marina MBIC11017]
MPIHQAAQNQTHEVQEANARAVEGSARMIAEAMRMSFRLMRMAQRNAQQLSQQYGSGASDSDTPDPDTPDLDEDIELNPREENELSQEADIQLNPEQDITIKVGKTTVYPIPEDTQLEQADVDNLIAALENPEQLQEEVTVFATQTLPDGSKSNENVFHAVPGEVKYDPHKLVEAFAQQKVEQQDETLSQDQEPAQIVIEGETRPMSWDTPVVNQAAAPIIENIKNKVTQGAEAIKDRAANALERQNLLNMAFKGGTVARAAYDQAAQIPGRAEKLKEVVAQVKEKTGQAIAEVREKAKDLDPKQLIQGKDPVQGPELPSLDDRISTLQSQVGDLQWQMNDLQDQLKSVDAKLDVIVNRTNPPEQSNNVDKWHNNLGGMVKEKLQQIKEKITTAIQSIKDKISEVINNFKATAFDKVEQAKEKVTEVKDNVTSRVDNTVQSVRQGIADIQAGMTNAAVAKLVQQYGQEQPDGSRVYNGDRFSYQTQGDSVTISAKGRGNVFQNGQLTDKANVQDAQAIQALPAKVEQEFAHQQSEKATASQAVGAGGRRR